MPVLRGDCRRCAADQWLHEHPEAPRRARGGDHAADAAKRSTPTPTRGRSRIVEQAVDASYGAVRGLRRRRRSAHLAAMSDGQRRPVRPRASPRPWPRRRLPRRRRRTRPARSPRPSSARASRSSTARSSTSACRRSQRDLGVGGADISWLINAYLLPLGALVLLGGVAGDRWGRKRVFLAGMAVFTLASLACAARTRLRLAAGGACRCRVWARRFMMPGQPGPARRCVQRRGARPRHRHLGRCRGDRRGGRAARRRLVGRRRRLALDLPRSTCRSPLVAGVARRALCRREPRAATRCRSTGAARCLATAGLAALTLGLRCSPASTAPATVEPQPIPRRPRPCRPTLAIGALVDRRHAARRIRPARGAARRAGDDAAAPLRHAQLRRRHLAHALPLRRRSAGCSCSCRTC